MPKKIFFLGLIITIISIISGCALQKKSPKLENVTLKLKWLHQAQFAGNYAAKEKGIYEKYGVNMYADVLFTTEDIINKKPDLVEKFVRATLDGWQFAIENQEETIDMILKYAVNSSREHQKYMLETSIPLIYTGDSPLGWMDAKQWEGVQRTLFDQEILKKPIRPENAYTMEFLNKIYNIKNKQKVSVRLSWLHQNQFAGFYAADQMGFYNQEGINVNLHSAGYGLSVEDQILAGESSFGVSTSINFLKKISEGKKLKAIAAIHQQDPTVFISLKEKNMKTLQDFKNITLAGSDTGIESVKMMLTKNNIDFSSVNFIPKTTTLTDTTILFLPPKNSFKKILNL